VELDYDLDDEPVVASYNQAEPAEWERIKDMDTAPMDGFDATRQVISMFPTIIYVLVAVVSIIIPVIYYRLHKRSTHPLGMDERALVSTNMGFFNSLYAFLLGFAIVTLWTNFNNAQILVGNEAQSINNLYHLALLIPDSEELLDTIQKYDDSIVSDELPEMDRFKYLSEKTQTLFQEIWYRVHKLKARSDIDRTFYDRLTETLCQMSDYRLQRFVHLESHLYPLLWVIIVVGFVFAIIGFYYLNTEKLKIQLVFDSILIAMLLLNIWLILELDSPFSGYLKVSPRAYMVVGKRMRVMDDYIKTFEKLDLAKKEHRIQREQLEKKGQQEQREKQELEEQQDLKEQLELKEKMELKEKQERKEKKGQKSSP
jgi:hypothetical protein